MKNDTKHYVFYLKDLGDERGSLAVIHSNVDVPFDIKRIFYNYGTAQGAQRGNHANKNSAFVFISLAGSCIVEVDDGYLKHEYVLDSPDKALFVDKMLWKTMKDFSKDNILLVLSDNKYDETEYIRDYNIYIETRGLLK